jgi:hypothetical protein
LEDNIPQFLEDSIPQFLEDSIPQFLEARGYNPGPLDNSINYSETNVTVMPRITCDAIYSGSDLFSIVVTIISYIRLNLPRW